MSEHESVLSAGVIIVNFDEQIPRYLLLCAYNYWDFPKGIVESGEDPLAGAIREVEEETTLTALDFRWGTDFRETPPYRRGKVARYYMAASPSTDVYLPVSEELGHPEHDEFCWFDYEATYVRLSERVKPIFDWAHKSINTPQAKEMID